MGAVVIVVDTLSGFFSYLPSKQNSSKIKAIPNELFSTIEKFLGVLKKKLQESLKYDSLNSTAP